MPYHEKLYSVIEEKFIELVVNRILLYRKFFTFLKNKVIFNKLINSLHWKVFKEIVKLIL